MAQSRQIRKHPWNHLLCARRRQLSAAINVVASKLIVSIKESVAGARDLHVLYARAPRRLSTDNKITLYIILFLYTDNILK